jgi:hypothetical protein
VWALLEPVFRAGETLPHDPGISEVEARTRSRPGTGEPLVDPCRGMGPRLLALLGAFSREMHSISTIAPLLQPPPSPVLPAQHGEPVG